ncbi:hypothetical protein [Haladaptatus caseinilyticus]|uniref:hypothetical protein n=1 Tax=Haladaptatus caseinilyticus TaxID=2993314 RepID=UPI00224AE3C2|nr:hypothetical protein [Haladaptatus caseinilyticus]
MPTYNIIEEGADNSGNSAIDPVLNEIVGSDTTIIFPSGTYLLNDLVVYSGITNLHLIAPNGARLVPGTSGDNVSWFDVYSNGFVLDGFELDMRDIEVPPFVRMNNEAGDWELKRLVTRGKVRAATDSNIGSGSSSDARTYFRLSAAEGTRGLLQDCYFHEGACEPTEASNRRAILVESGKGELVFNRCWFELWGENTIYAKKPEGPLNIYNCFWRNTQVGVRVGGNSEVRNCVSIKDDAHPVQAWSGGSLQRGVSVEAVVPADPENGINSYDGTATVADSDFYHRYPDSSCGGPITASTPCERISINNVRISYNSEKYHDAIYTLNGRMNDGDPANLKYLELQKAKIHNDHDNQYAVSIGQTPDQWGDVAGELGGSGPQTDSAYIRDQMTTNGDPTLPDTRPPLPSVPPLGEVPLQSAQLVRIDNSGNNASSAYQITGGTYVLPAGDDGATVAMDWGSNNAPVRPPDSEQATGSVPPGEVYAFYVTGGIVSTSASGAATWTVDGTPYSPGSVLSTNTLSSNQTNRDQWHQVEASDQSTGVVVGKPLSYNGNQPAHVRLRNSITGGFDYKLEEWEYLDGGHTTETFNTLAVPPAEYKLQLSNDLPYLVKSGTVSTDHEFTTVSLGDFFGSGQPVILAQSQSFEGSEAIVTQVSDVSSDTFDVKVQEEGGEAHRVETIGYIALQPEVGHLDGRPFEVQRTAEIVTDEWTRIDFQQQYNRPQFIAGLQTYHGLDTAGVRYRNLTSSSVEVMVEEEQSDSSETNHATEVIGYAVFGEPAILTKTISSNQPSSDHWHEIDLDVQSPRIVIAKPLSNNDGQPSHLRLQNVTKNSFQYKIEEWKYLDGVHIDEIFHMMAVEPTEQELLLDDGSTYRAEAGTTSIAGSFINVSLGSSFGSERPVVFTQVQTFNGPQPIVTRVRNVSNDSFGVGLQEEGEDEWHTQEELGYITLEQTSGQINGASFEVQRTEETVTDQWTHITFSQEYESPRFISHMQTFNGVDTSNLRYQNLTNTGVDVKIEEEKSTDGETRHQNAEEIGYAVFENSI